MAQHPSSRRTWLPHGAIEQTGVLMWLIGVFVIGLQVAILVIDQPTFLATLRFSATTLYGIAVVVVGVGCVGSIARTAYRGYTREPATTRRAARSRSTRSRWPRLSRILALAVECLLAATIIQAGIELAEPTGLSWIIIARSSALPPRISGWRCSMKNRNSA